ncbi:PfkB family carbohydrate kinase [Streptomyces sp. WM6378]|uniref:PfkB family carbohydrate kinase n=1 Tax=Streptomyces sp. WM6378 TaxID=1415557 RepID=UPI003B63B2E8
MRPRVLQRGGRGRQRPRADTGDPGAGVAYVSGFLYGRLTGRDVRECGRFGALAGAHACTAPAATDPISRISLLAADQIA